MSEEQENNKNNSSEKKQQNKSEKDRNGVIGGLVFGLILAFLAYQIYSFIPFPFIHAYHLPTLHTYPSITEKVRRIGKYHIELETELL